jgi:hypothetical protein
MAHHPKSSAKNKQGEYAVFSNALKKVLSVSHDEMKARLKSEGKRNRATKRPSASSRASSGHD